MATADTAAVTALASMAAEKMRREVFMVFPFIC
jgi:hypothetical protein